MSCQFLAEPLYPCYGTLLMLVQETCRLYGNLKPTLRKTHFLNDSFLFFIRILVFLKIMHCSVLKMLTEWSFGILWNRGEQILKRFWKYLPKFLQIHHNQNANITAQESVDTLEDILLLIDNLLTGRDKRPHTPGYLYFKTLLVYL